MLHRDLKPANAMVREDNSLALIDFGLAKGDNSTSITVPGEMHGTPYYMSPEQIEDKPFDEQSDLYALGVIFYEMLVGERPFVGDSTPEILYQHVSLPIPTVPEHLKRFQPLVNSMLAKDKSERVRSASEIMQMVRALSTVMS